MSYHPNFFCRPAELMIHKLVLYYHQISNDSIPENGMKPEEYAPSKKKVKPCKIIFQMFFLGGSKSRFSQRGVTVFQPCMLMLKGFLWLMVQVSETFLSHDIQMRQARPWRPRHRPCLFDNTALPGVSFGNSAPELRRYYPHQDAGASSDTVFGDF